jgi:predicted ester cyclase
MDIPATGSRVTAHGTYILRFRGHKIAEMWDYWDNLNVLQQLGAASGPEQARS